jgi:hypothetical protein
MNTIKYSFETVSTHDRCDISNFDEILYRFLEFKIDEFMEVFYPVPKELNGSHPEKVDHLKYA